MTLNDHNLSHIQPFWHIILGPDKSKLVYNKLWNKGTILSFEIYTILLYKIVNPVRFLDFNWKTTQLLITNWNVINKMYSSNWLAFNWPKIFSYCSLLICYKQNAIFNKYNNINRQFSIIMVFDRFYFFITNTTVINKIYSINSVNIRL